MDTKTNKKLSRGQSKNSIVNTNPTPTITTNTTAINNNNNNFNNNNNSCNNAKRPMMLKRMDTKISMFAPEAEVTEFDDFPVLTICPHCRLKVVTKTSYSKTKPFFLCCCPNEFIFMFKDIHHNCPKCNKLIAKYNRFCVSWCSKVQVVETKLLDEMSSQVDLSIENGEEKYKMVDAMSDNEDERALLLRQVSDNVMDDNATNVPKNKKRLEKNFRKMSKVQKPV